MPHVTELRRSRVRESLLVVLLLFGLALVPTAGAALINVDTLADEDVFGNGTCSLREAMTAALNQAAYHECAGGTSDNDLITFSVTGVIALGSDLPTVESTVEIAGPGVSNLTISGNDSARIFLSEGLLILHDLTLVDGFSTQGGAIYINDGAQLSVSRVLFVGNNASPGNAGAIFDDDGSSLQINDCTFVGNTAPKGGAIYVGDSASNINITNSTFIGNSSTTGGGAPSPTDRPGSCRS